MRTRNHPHLSTNLALSFTESWVWSLEEWKRKWVVGYFSTVSGKLLMTIKGNFLEEGTEMAQGHGKTFCDVRKPVLQ